MTSTTAPNQTTSLPGRRIRSSLPVSGGVSWRVMGMIAAFGVLFGLSGTCAASEAEIVPLDGEAFVGSPVAVVDGTLVFADETGERRFPAEKLLRFGTLPDEARPPLVTLTGNGILAGDVVRMEEGTLTLLSDTFGVLRLAEHRVTGIVFVPPVDALATQQLLDDLAQTDRETDRLLLTNGDELSGEVLGIGEEVLEFSAELGDVEIPRSRLAAVQFDRSNSGGQTKPRPWAMLGFADGSLVPAMALQMDGDREVVLPWDDTSWPCPLERLVFLQPLQSEATYLSALQPRDYRHVPFLTISRPYRRDRNVLGGRIRSGGQGYLKGLGMYSASRLTFDLDGQYRQFAAALAIDDASGGWGSVRFRVFVDGEVALVSDPIRGGEVPTPITVSIAGAKRLDLVVDFAERADELDLALWIDARLLP